MAVQLTRALEHRLQHLAAGTNRSADELAQEALENFCSAREQLAMAVKEGDDDFRRGDFFTHEEVRAHMEEILAGR